MRAWLSAWRRLILAAALAVLAGAGIWLGVAGTGATGPAAESGRARYHPPRAPAPPRS